MSPPIIIISSLVALAMLRIGYVYGKSNADHESAPDEVAAGLFVMTHVACFALIVAAVVRLCLLYFQLPQ